MEIDEEKLKEFLKMNLVIETRYSETMGAGNDIVVGLRFINENKTFTEDTVYIPD